jgi:hypothetical protein
MWCPISLSFDIDSNIHNPFIRGSTKLSFAFFRFNAPSGLSWDSFDRNYLLVADSNNHVIRKVFPDSTVSAGVVVTTFAGISLQSGKTFFH